VNIRNTQLFADCREFYVLMFNTDGSEQTARVLKLEFESLPPTRRIAMENAMLQLGEKIAKRLKML